MRVFLEVFGWLGPGFDSIPTRGGEVEPRRRRFAGIAFSDVVPIGLDENPPPAQQGRSVSPCAYDKKSK